MAGSPWQKRKILYLALLATLVMIVYAQFVLGHFSQCFHLENAVNSLGLSFGYSSSDVMHFVQNRTEEQLHCYIFFLQVWDFIFPILYTLMYLFWIVFLFEKRVYLYIIPVLHMISDWIENTIEITMIENYLEHNIIPENLILSGSTVTVIKWCLSLLTYSILVVGIVIQLRKLIKKNAK